MGRPRVVGIRSVTAVAAWAVLGAALAAPAVGEIACSDIEVVFARGTGAAPGLGWVGEAFVDSLRSKVGDDSVGVYAVDYLAGYDFSTSASAGAADASAHVQNTVLTCPGTRIVLGGMSQGAGVIDLITLDPRPIAGLTPVPLPPEAADHVAAVAVFGNPSRNLPGFGPIDAISERYGPKSIDLCAPDDVFCSSGDSLSAHFSYVRNGMVEQAATFVAGRL